MIKQTNTCEWQQEEWNKHEHNMHLVVTVSISVGKVYEFSNIMVFLESDDIIVSNFVKFGQWQ